MKSERDGRLELKAFIEPEEVDSLYFEKTHILWPAKGNETSYDVLCAVLASSGRYLVGTAVMDKSTKVVVLRYGQGCLLAQVCTYDANVRWNEHALVTGAIGERGAPDETLVNLAMQVFDALDDTFDFSARGGRVRPATARRQSPPTAAGQPVPIAPTVKPEPAVDLMEALKASVAAAAESKKETGVARRSAQPRRSQRSCGSQGL